MRPAFIFFAAFVATTPAAAATFTGEAHDHTVIVFSTSKTYEHCRMSQPFSFTHEGERLTTATTCNIYVVPGVHKEACRATHDLIVDPKIEGPVTIEKCEPGRDPAASPKKK